VGLKAALALPLGCEILGSNRTIVGLKDGRR